MSKTTIGPQSTRRVSFGSVFDVSSGQDGGGQNNGGQQNDGNWNEWSAPLVERRTAIQTDDALFKLEIKPKDPPIFYGRAAEDVSTWISKVSDFFYLTGATERQQVAYAATLLQEAAADWWGNFAARKLWRKARRFLRNSLFGWKSVLEVRHEWIEPGPP